VLRIPNVQDQALNLSDLKFAVDPGTLAADGAVEPGDFLFIRTNGSVNLIGRGAVIVDAPPRECFFASYLIRLRLARVEGLWRWFAFAWHTSVVRDQLVRDAASSAGQHNVSLSAASKYLMPLPPAREQERILAEVDGLDTGRGSAAQDTRICRDRIDRLRQSILKWAFEGRLVDGRSAFSDGQQASAAHEVVDGGK
jgi:type I restriction enzyme S subunit